MDVTALLAKEVLIILFRSFPGRFVLVGGGALHWIFHSPRLSVDIDLKPVRPEKEDLIRQMAAVLTRKLPPITLPLSLSVACQVDLEAQALRVLVDGRPALRVELAPITPVTGKEKHL